jgi:hypothetical protein
MEALQIQYTILGEPFCIRQPRKLSGFRAKRKPVFAKKWLARQTGCCIVSSLMPLELCVIKASRKFRQGALYDKWNRKLTLH